VQYILKNIKYRYYIVHNMILIFIAVLHLVLCMKDRIMLNKMNQKGC